LSTFSLAVAAAAGAMIVTVSTPALAGQAGSAAAGICTSAAHPKLAARLSRGIADAVRGQRSVVGLTAADPSLHLTCRLDQGSHFDAASVIKVTIISALLRKVGGQAHLTTKQRSLAWQMITESSNSAATRLWDEVGIRGMQRFLNLTKMKHTKLNHAWGLTKITAQDELTLLRLLMTRQTLLSTSSRNYVLWLMAHVIASQRWGVPAGAPSRVTVHVKNGWLPYPTGKNWHINSIGAFTGHHMGYEIVVLTSQNPSMTYGIRTVEAAARVINRELAGK
jgi:Beta-lactamase enzyme family